MKKKGFSRKEIEQRELDLISAYDARNLEVMRDKRPDLVDRIDALLEVGHSPKNIGGVIRRENPQMWPESKFAESVARALMAEQDYD